jgi:hypothetical protein
MRQAAQINLFRHRAECFASAAFPFAAAVSRARGIENQYY